MPQSGYLHGDDAWALVHFVRSMSSPEQREKVEMKRFRIVAPLVGTLPEHPDSGAWRVAHPVNLHLMPLWWRAERPEQLTVRAVHDGEKIALLLAWADDTHDATVMRPQDFRDAAAVHACRVRAYKRNGIVVRSGSTYDYQNYADICGNHATPNWNPRQCAKGYTFHRVLYGPNRLRHPIVRKGWRAWAEAGFPELTPEMRSKYLFDRRVEDTFVQISWEDAFRHTAECLQSIARRYSGEDGAERLTAQGYQPEMIEAMGGAGTRTIQDARRHGAPGSPGQVRHVPPQQLPGTPERSPLLESRPGAVLAVHGSLPGPGGGARHRAHQRVRTGYCRMGSSGVTRTSPPTRACATSMRSNGSRCRSGSLATWSADSSPTARGSIPWAARWAGTNSSGA